MSPETYQNTMWDVFNIKESNHDIPVIPEDLMSELVKNLVFINKCVKTRQMHNLLRKSTVYTVKRNIIDYIIYMVANGTYPNMDIQCDGVYQEHIYSTGKQRLLSVVIILPDGTDVKFHYNIDRFQSKTQLITIQTNHIKKGDVYVVKPEIPEAELRPKEIVDQWCKLLNVCVSYGMAPFQMTNNKVIFNQRISSFWPKLVCNGGNLLYDKDRSICLATPKKDEPYTESIRNIIQSPLELKFDYKLGCGYIRE